MALSQAEPKTALMSVSQSDWQCQVNAKAVTVRGSAKQLAAGIKSGCSIGKVKTKRNELEKIIH